MSAAAPRLLVVSRADLFAPRPQPIQVLRAAAGLASAGAEVTLVMDAVGRGQVDVAAVEHHLGTPLGPHLDLRPVQGHHPGGRGLRRRALLLRLLGRRWGAILTRDLRVLRQLARLRSLRRVRSPLVLEWHAIPSTLGERDEGEQSGAELADGHLYVSEGLSSAVRERLAPRARGLVLPNACAPLPGETVQRRLEGLEGAGAVVCAGLARPPADDGLVASLAADLPAEGLSFRGIGPPTGAPVPPAAADAALDGALCQLALYRDDLNTRRFACPLKVAQAAATGVPLIATDLPTVRALVEPDRTALLVPPGDVGAVRGAIATLAADRPRARALAEAALARVPGRTWTDRGGRLLSWLEAP